MHSLARRPLWKDTSACARLRARSSRGRFGSFKFAIIPELQLCSSLHVHLCVTTCSSCEGWRKIKSSRRQSRDSLTTPRLYSAETHFLSGSQVHKLVLSRFNESGVDHGCHAPQIKAFNETIKCIAECVYNAVKKRVSTQRCIISNTDTDAGTGLHWFTVSFDIDADP